MSEKKFATPFPEISSGEKKVHRKRMKAWAAGIKVLVVAFAIIGFLCVLFFLSLLSAFHAKAPDSRSLPDEMALMIDFDASFPERPNSGLWSGFSGEADVPFAKLVSAIKTAATDDRVKFLVGRGGLPNLGLAQIQELRQEVENFRKSGKKAYFYSEGFGMMGGGTSAYYLATAFDEIVMMPNSELGITGVAFEVPFFKNVLDKIGIKPELYSRYEYKTAAASLLDNKFSTPFKAELNKLGKDIFNELVAGIAQGRGVSEAEVRKFIDRAPLFAEDAVGLRLVDEVSFYPEFFDRITKNEAIETVWIDEYAGQPEKSRPAGKVAVLTLDGVIVSGESNDNPFNGEISTGSDTVGDMLNDVAADKEIKALVLRIDSPGGGYTASSKICHDVEYLKKKLGIPVIVSMGNYAASGGYFMALSGDYLFAEPSTITGSIGVLGGKFVLEGLWQKLGINWEGINFGKNAAIASANHKFSPAEVKIFNQSLDRIYQDFTAKVSAARNIAPKQMDLLARGRVWTGRQAVENGLADELGGLDKAIEYAKNKAGPTDEVFNVVYYPKPLSWPEQVEKLLNGGVGISAGKVLKSFGLETEGLGAMQRLKYEMVLPPFDINY